MPIAPAVDPPLEAFGPLVPPATLGEDALRGGRAPWAEAQAPLSDFRRDASPLLFGGGVFGHAMYNSEDVLYSDAAVRALRLAFRYGINALDSSPYYFPS